MIDVSKLDSKTKIEMIIVWLELLAKKKLLSRKDIEMISVVVAYLVKEVST